MCLFFVLLGVLVLECRAAGQDDPTASDGDGRTGAAIPANRDRLNLSARCYRREFGDPNLGFRLDAGDLSRTILAIFSPAEPTDPNCDANEDERVDAGDLSCTIMLIFEGDGACSMR